MNLFSRWCVWMMIFQLRALNSCWNWPFQNLLTWMQSCACIDCGVRIYIVSSGSACRRLLCQTNLRGSGSLKRTSRGCELESSETNVIKRLVVQTHAFISVFDELMHGERGIVRLHHCIRHLRRRHNTESHHHAIRVLFPDLRNEQCAHARSRSASHWMTHLKTWSFCATNSTSVRHNSQDI